MIAFEYNVLIEVFMSDLDFEQGHLDKVVNDLKQTRSVVIKKLDKLNESKKDDNYLAVAQSYAYARRIADIDKHGSSPYFAKIVYKDDSEQKPENLYIGKVGFCNYNNDLIVIDWRAPISTIYYDSEVGDVSFVSPDGVCHGQMLLKRQLEIANGKVLSLNDSDLMTNDELLRPYLNQSADKRLKNIIATIQAEQNAIIRAPRQNLIVQGVAGSGKTTVALHRLSYLIYQMKKFDTTADYLIIGPNKVFLKYISSVLPELDTESATQLTYEEIAQMVVGEDFKLKDKNEVLKDLSDDKPEPVHLKFKNSKKFQNLIDNFLEDFAIRLLPNNINFMGVEIFSKDQLIEIYNQNRGGDIQSEFLRIAKILVGKMSNPKVSKVMLAQVFNRAKEEGINLSLKDEWKLRDIFEGGKIEFFKKQIMFKKISILKIYGEFIKYLSEIGGFDYLVKSTQQNIKNKVFDFEDMPALIYLKQRIMRFAGFDNICHVIIDEAQDLGEFHYIALKYLFPNCVFDLFGDMNQAIYGYSSIENWGQANNILLNGNCQFYHLTKSYRTTIEIMEASNQIGSCIDLVIGQPVIRHGERVKVFETTKNEYDTILTNYVKELQNKFTTVAVLCKSEKECEKVSEILTKFEINHKILQDDSEICGVMITTVYQSKGLEFDGVIIANASENMYDTKKVVDMKLLYVGMTRAMHELKILSVGNVVSVLESLK